MPAPVVAEIATASMGSSGSSGCDGGRSILFHTTTRGRAAVTPSSSRSSFVNGRDRSSITIVRSATVTAALRARNAFLFDDIRRLANARRIDQRQRETADVGLLGQQIARRAGNRGDDRAIRVEQRVEQARLADIRRADDRHRRALANKPAARGLRQQRIDARDDARRSRARFLRRDEVIALVRKIQRRLELRDDVEQLLLNRGNRRRQRAFELIEGGARLQRRHGLDQIGDRLRLDEIELLMKPGEFTLRAFLNRKIDLVQAEAVADLIDAVTPLQARAAFDQLEGTLTKAIGAIERDLFDVDRQARGVAGFPGRGLSLRGAEGSAHVDRRA